MCCPEKFGEKTKMASNGGGGQGNEKGKRPASGMGACSAVVTSEKVSQSIPPSHAIGKDRMI